MAFPSVMLSKSPLIFSFFPDSRASAGRDDALGSTALKVSAIVAVLQVTATWSPPWFWHSTARDQSRGCLGNALDLLDSQDTRLRSDLSAFCPSSSERRGWSEACTAKTDAGFCSKKNSAPGWPRKPLANPSRYPNYHPFPFFNNPNSPGKSIVGTLVVLIKKEALAKQKSLDYQASSPPGSLPSHLAHDQTGHESQCPASNVVWSRNSLTLDSAQDWGCQNCCFHRTGQLFLSCSFVKLVAHAPCQRGCQASSYGGVKFAWIHMLWILSSHTYKAMDWHTKGHQTVIPKVWWSKITAEEIPMASQKNQPKSKGRIHYPEPGSEEFK